jgi:hypothetical protein
MTQNNTKIQAEFAKHKFIYRRHNNSQLPSVHFPAEHYVNAIPYGTLRERNYVSASGDLNPDIKQEELQVI